MHAAGNLEKTKTQRKESENVSEPDEGDLDGNYACLHPKTEKAEHAKRIKNLRFI